MKIIQPIFYPSKSIVEITDSNGRQFKYATLKLRHKKKEKLFFMHGGTAAAGTMLSIYANLPRRTRSILKR